MKKDYFVHYKLKDQPDTTSCMYVADVDGPEQARREWYKRMIQMDAKDARIINIKEHRAVRR